MQEITRERWQEREFQEENTAFIKDFLEPMGSVGPSFGHIGLETQL